MTILTDKSDKYYLFFKKKKNIGDISAPRLIVFLFLFLTFPFISKSQSNKFEIDYLCTVHKIPDLAKMKVPVDRITKFKDTIVKSRDTANFEEIVPEISFSQNIKIIAFKSRSYVLLDRIIGRKGMKINSPDSALYSRKKWSEVSHGIKKNISGFDLIYHETKEHKKILGYDCIKFLARNDKNGEELEIWASKSLPKTLLPIIGANEFRYGILEVNELSNSWTIKAQKIYK